MTKTDLSKNSRSEKNDPVSIAIFGSGRGSNARNLLEFFQEKDLININLIISNKSEAGILQVAEEFSVPSAVFSKSQLSNKESILSILKEHDIDFIVLAGFLLKIPSYIIEEFPGKIINTHPALLPSYGGKGMFGMHVHNAVKQAGERKSGMTVHIVNENYDEGSIIFQKEILIPETDSAEEIAKKIQSLEYEWLPKIVESLVER